MTGWRMPALVRAAVCGVTVAALVVVSGCGGGSSHPSAKGGSGGSSGSGAPTSAAPTVTPQSVAQSFLDAWAAGDYAKAASFTDAPDKATTGLKAEMTSLAPQKLTLTLGQASTVSSSGASTPASSSGATTPAGTPTAPATSAAPAVGKYAFAVTADFGNNLQWPYQSSLTLVQGPAGTPVVHWTYSVIHPSLLSTALLKAAPPKMTVTDATGAQIDTKAHPSLLNAVNSLSTHLPAGQTPTALTVEFTDANTGAQIPNSQSFPLGASTSTPVTVKTTLKPAVQNAMEAALKAYPDSAMVAIQPSTGAILGMASNSPGNLSMAYKAARAPGSTFKVITAALALQQGVKPGDSVDCPGFATVESLRIDNDKDLANGIQHATLKDDFLQSCNTGFINLAVNKKLGDYSALANEAKTYFGMNQKWDLGMGAATYGAFGDQQVPPADGLGLFARDAFGQGNITMSPLTMASVAATVCAGQFRQPFLVSGATPTATGTPLPGDVANQLTLLMQGVASSGTAAGVFPGLTGIAAKTGSAESNDTAKTKKTDSWMVVFDKQHDIAFAALVLNGGFGRDAAGPAINKVLHSPGVR